MGSPHPPLMVRHHPLWPHRLALQPLHRHPRLSHPQEELQWLLPLRSKPHNGLTEFLFRGTPRA